jgi:crotonobetainyl-CoA:carnitine CoA-transferase CaiB-like acyl-CoA transferase
MRLPLEGVRILAISQFGAGPYSTMVLAELGAEVIKVEDPSVGGDISRSVPPHVIEHDSLYFQSFNRNKKSITLNLKTKEGRQIIEKLVRVSHAVFNNLRGDQVSKLGLNYASLKHANPKIVCCSLTGFGVSGPQAAEPGYDYLMQAYAGYMSLTGDPQGPPAACGISVIDHAAGFAAMLGLVAAMYAAEQTGEGRDVEVSLFDTAFSMLSYLAMWNLNRDYQPVRRTGSAHQTLVPVQTFRTNDGYLVIFCAKEKFWRELCTIMQLEHLLSDERFANFAQRFKNRELVVSTLQNTFLTRSTDDWVKALRGKVPCSPVNDLSQALKEPLLVDREMIVETQHQSFGKIRQLASPIKLAGTSMNHRRAPGLGEHTAEILKQYLGYDDDAIADFRQRQVV